MEKYALFIMIYDPVANFETHPLGGLFPIPLQSLQELGLRPEVHRKLEHKKQTNARHRNIILKFVQASGQIFK